MNNKTGCITWIILSCIVLLWGWKLIDFYVLKPALVKKGLNETLDSVSPAQITSARQVEFNRNWSELERNSEIDFDFTGFRGDSFVVQWSDTLHVPVFPSINHNFVLKKLVR